MGLRNTLLCTGLVSILGAQEVYAADGKDTGYAELSRPELNKRVQKRSTVLTENNFKKEIFDYDGAAIILFDSTCNNTENADTIDRNMEIVYLGLIDKFEDAQVNQLPLKFAYMDGCKFKWNNAQTYIGLDVTTTETHMYLDGKLIDRKIGGPISEEGVKPLTKDMTYWINYDLLAITEPGEENIVLLYQGNMKWKEYPRSVLR